ncbi:MAG: choice-of-anchor D domain-containing protein [Calditrichaeota bacterium]|nr:MAG: choice-of-anchor D domain-containing protein [Calditrichota bacterium]
MGKCYHFGLILLILLVLLAPLSADWRPGEMKVRLHDLSPSQIQELFQKGFIVDVIRGNLVYLLVTPEELNRLQQLGYTPEVVIPDMARYAQELLNSQEMVGYHDYYGTLNLVDSLLQQFPNLIQKVTYGFSLGSKELYAVKISDHVQTDEAEPEVAFDGCHHGDEIMSSECIVRFMRDLCTQYGSDPQITRLVNEREIWIYPFANPDGRQALTRYNNAGVDINRDWGYMWDGWGGSTAAYSQPETQAMLRWYLDHQFVIAQTGHGGAELISHPWSYRPDPSPDHAFVNFLAGGYATSSGYPSLPYGPGFSGLYPINGSAKDTYYGIRGSMAWTLEVSSNKTPPASQIPTYYGYNKNAMLYLVEMAGQGIAGTVTDAVTGQPVPALVWVRQGSNEYWPVYADPQVGDFHKFVLPGTYEVKITANGYQPVTFTNVTVVDTGATWLNVFLQPALGTFAYQVIASRIPGNNFSDEGMVPWAFGAPDGRSYSLGKAGWIVLDMGSLLQDFPGKDLTVYEGDSSPEGYTVSVSTSYLGPWTILGSASGTAQFDLASAGLSAYRYVRIEDDGDGPLNWRVPDFGFDLDAVEGRSVPPTGPFVVPVALSVQDSASNGNRRLEAGEQAELQFVLYNLGSGPADNVSLKLVSLDTLLTVLADSAMVGHLNSGDSARAGGFLVQVDPQTPHQSLLQVQLNIQADGGYSWTVLQNVVVHQGPRIEVTPVPLVFPATFVNFPGTLQLSIQNQGADTLHIFSATTGTPHFWAAAGQLTVAPGKSSALKMTFQPDDTLLYRDTLRLYSDDPTHLVFQVPLEGRGVLAPDIQLSVDSIAVTLLPTDSSEAVFDLQNTGAGPLNFGARITSFLPGKEDGGVAVNGGGDAFGHVWLDSDEPGGPAFSWVDLSDGSGTEISFSSSNAISNPIDLGFDFALYDQAYHQLRVCTNGWLSFTTFSVSFNNVPLPNPLAPRTLIAPLWDNLEIQSDSKVLYRKDPDRFIVQWNRVYSAGGGGPYTFQVILFQDGDVVLQYLQLNNPDPGYTIGIQNEAGTDGFTVAHNQPYAHDSLAVLITRKSWVSVSPQSGSVAPQSSQTITLKFRTQDFPEGTFWAAVEITSNDPDEPTLLLPIQMTVSSVVSVAEESVVLPTTLTLFQNYPNPFNPTTTIRFQVPEPMKVRVVVYNALGQLVRTLLDRQLTAGEYQVVWDGTSEQGNAVPSGLYFYELQTERTRQIRKMILLR